MGVIPSTRRRRARRLFAAACGAAAIAITAAACGSSGTSSAGGAAAATPTGGTPVKGGTATYALPPSTVPNYIFPFDSSTFFSVSNSQYFQYLMYRPLYWFGQGTAPTLNSSLSLADPPSYNGRNVTIHLKGWKWSNGEQVSSQDVMFWLNMLQAVGSSDWGAYVPGGFPTNVSDIKAVNATTLTMTMNKSYNPTWFTSNELSQITPMPQAWDRTASGPSHCSTTVSDCAAVYAYLDSQSKNLSGWTSSPLWSIVDGPWKLTAFNSDGNSTFVPNGSYGGSKAHLAEFQEVPFTTESAEYNVLQAGSAGGGSQKINVGYLPTIDAPAKPANAAIGRNPVNGYYLDPLYPWGINYFPVNYQSTTGNAGVIKQLYFREALQLVMNQAAVIAGPLKGYGEPTVGPVGSYPATNYLSAKGKQGDPFPYNPTKAKSLLTSHGWTITNGAATCTAPAKCGPGIKQGQTLSFTLPYATGTTWIEQEMTQLQSNASQIGIKLNLEPKPFDQVTAIAAGNCVVAKISCNWDMGNWGGGWTFAPDFYPSGETLFQSGSGANSGGYTNAQNDSLINSTLTSSNLQLLWNWQDYLSTQIPVIWQPNGVYELTEIANNLRGVMPQSTTLAINPENWFFVSS
jgi:peptide/nickel transport system substrate-binding protein